MNTKFRNYVTLRLEDQFPFEIVMHYWNDTGLLEEDESGWRLKIALISGLDSAEIRTENISATWGQAVIVKGLVNEAEVEQKLLRCFETTFSKQCGIIMFPEVIGTTGIVEQVKDRMKIHPEYCTFVLLPTICNGERNTLIVLGPGGVEILRQDKGTPFILRDNRGERKKEGFQYTNKMHVLITKELGNVAFPICAEVLDPSYYHVLADVARVDTVLCPSFSPGIGAFRKTLVKGLASMLLSVWVNTCSAKCVSANGQVPEVLGIVQLPDAKVEEEPLHEIRRRCQGQCFPEVCYFEAFIKYQNAKFQVESMHYCCA